MISRDDLLEMLIDISDKLTQVFLAVLSESEDAEFELVGSDDG